MEVLCAILILGVGLVGLTHGLTTALSASKESELQTGAASLAASRIEIIRADGFLLDGTEEGEGDDGSGLYRWEQVISPTDPAGLHRVKVSVHSARSGQLIYELETLLFDPPLQSAASPSDNRGTRGKDRRDERRGR